MSKRLYEDTAGYLKMDATDDGDVRMFTPGLKSGVALDIEELLILREACSEGIARLARLQRQREGVPR